MGWLETAQDLLSKGQQSRKAESLADLHRRREETQSQYFTPRWVGAGIWQALGASITKAAGEDGQVAVVDTSVGCGRLLADGPIEYCEFYGLDTDERCIDALTKATAGLHADFQFASGALENLRLRNMGLAIINPPFSLTLQSPLMDAYPCTSHGPYGPHTTAKSHEYALEQALGAASVVAALLPVTMEAYCRDKRRLAAIARLPANTFKAEGANVQTAVFFFDRRDSKAVMEFDIAEGGTWPQLNLKITSIKSGRAPRFILDGVDDSTPTITTPVTGDKRVTLHHENRKLVLKFHCGLVEAKVLNGLLCGDLKKISGHRYPEGFRFQGDGLFYLDAYLSADDPIAALQETLNQIAELGGQPVVTPTLGGYFKRLIRRHQRAVTPFYHCVRVDAGEAQLQARARRATLLIPDDFSSPAVPKGAVVDVDLLGGEVVVRYEGRSHTLQENAFNRLFELQSQEEQAEAREWLVISEGVEAAFPELGKGVRAKLKALGINWLWEYQVNSLVELVIKPYGAIAGWQMGCGKARLSLALALYSGRGLVCVESGLVPEMAREINKIGLPAEDWQIITGVGSDFAVKKVNIISYNRLKSTQGGKTMLAAKLRRRFHTVVADEGSLLANPHSQQSRAVMRLAPRKLIVCDGTPIANYPRDLHSLVGVSAGQAVAHQPYGLWSQPMMGAGLLTSGWACPRGVDAFREKHVVLEWSTHEYREDNRTGAKREVPRINNVVDFRHWAGALVQRRLRNEPEVAPYASCPDPTERDFTADWDQGHLKHYIREAVEFVHEYKRRKEEANLAGKQLNLTAILARIQAVMTAASSPHAPGKNALCAYSPVTSKQRMVVEHAKAHVEAGRKTIIYARSPEVLERMQGMLLGDGIESVLFTGKQDIDKRVKDLDERFRFGDQADVLLMSRCAVRGLNLPMAKAVVLYDGDFKGALVQQLVDRTQRPDQDVSVFVDRFSLPGSIDEYVWQMADWKIKAADSGLDYGAGLTEDDEFFHLDHLLEEFCERTLNMRVHEAHEHFQVA